MNLKKIGEIFTSKFVGTGPSSYKKGIYRAAVSQRLRNTALKENTEASLVASKEIGLDVSNKYLSLWSCL